MEVVIPDLIKNACVDQFWEGIRILVTNATPNRTAMLIAGMTGARLTGTNTDAVVSWFEQLSQPCDGCASYSRSFKRITGRSITVADIVAYRDTDALVRVAYDDCADHKYGFRNIMGEGDLVVTEENRDLVWGAIDACSVAARTYCGASPSHPSVPTRDEIAREITMHKELKKNGGASGSTLDTARVGQTSEALAKLYAAHGATMPSFGADQLAKLDKTLAADAGDGKTICDACNAGNYGPLCVSSFGKEIGLPKHDPSSGASSSAWVEFAEKLDRSHGLFKMKGNIPQNMMATIEKSAAQLASNMSAGKMPTNVMDIGQDIINQCSADELQQLASNIPNIVPDLKKVYDGMGGVPGAGVPDMGPMMDSMLNAIGKGT
jgi:hypothetical protein